MENKKIRLGLDIGTTSVGWSILDEDNKLIDLGVRLFDDPASAKDGTLQNKTRREARSSRRRIHRIVVRKRELLKNLLPKYTNKNFEQLEEIVKKENIYELYGAKNILELKLKALKEKISTNELVHILYHYIHHRGYFYLTAEEKKEKIKENNNLEVKINKYPSELLFELLEKQNWYKNSKESRSIPASKWEEEINKIFEAQKLDESFRKEFIDLFKRQRDYATGPGSETSPTPYGLYRLENGEVKKIGNNLWDATIGKCTIYPQEIRGSKNAPIAELFNFFNDLNNLYFYEKANKFSSKTKESIFNQIKDSWKQNKEKNLTIEFIRKQYNESEDNIKEITKDNAFIDINGFRGTSKKDKEKSETFEFTKLKNYKILWNLAFDLNYLTNSEKELPIYNVSVLAKINELFIMIQKERDIDIQVKTIVNKFAIVNPTKEKLDLIEKELPNLKGFTQSHSLSYKAMLEFIQIAIKEPINSTLFFIDKIHNNSKKEEYKNKKYINPKIFNEAIISPTTRRAFIQTIKVINKIIKLYGNSYQIENITLEVPRDNNSYEEAKNITDMNKKNKDFLANMKKKYPTLDLENINAKTKEKLKLWEEQDHCDIYDGQDISFEDVCKNYSNLEVDHIIPLSISGIDAMYNKVLTKNINNSQKTNLTPFQWIFQKSSSDWQAFETRVKNNNKLSENKKKFLLFNKDPKNDMEDFINRQLVDTRYASKIVLNTLQDFFNTNKEEKVQVNVIRGAMTSFARRKGFMDLPKDRDDYYHHAVDATIISYLGNNSVIQKQINYFLYKEQDQRINNSKKIMDIETGELQEQTIEEMKKFYTYSKKIEDKDQISSKIAEQIKEKIKNNEVRFSRQLREISNKQLSDKTIYSFKRNDNDMQKGILISKLNLFGTDNEKLVDYFGEEAKNAENLIIFKEDPKLYQEIKRIFNFYYSKETKKNPFINYMKDLEHIQDDKYMPKHLKIGNQLLKSLRVLGDQKDISNVMILKNHNNNAVMESLNAIEIRIYKDVKDKYITIPINKKTLIFKNNKLIIDEKKLEYILDEQNISNKNKYLKITKGTIFLNKKNNKLFYSNGGGHFNQNKIELKYLFGANEKIGWIKQKQISFSTVSKEYDIVEADELGNIYNKINIEEYFKN